MKILIKNGRVINPANKIDDTLDLLIEDTKIIQVAKNIDDNADQVIDATNCLVTPGFIDLHVHLREPGFDYKESLKTGTCAAAAGGFTSVCCMPNTNPVIDNKNVVKSINDKANKEGVVNVLPIGSMTINQEGKTLSHIKEMVEEGIVAISEDGKTLQDSRLFLEAIKIAKEENIPVMSHCEDVYLTGKGQINEGIASKKFGVVGIPNEMEDVITARDIILNNKIDGRLHMCHVSTKESVNMIRLAKKSGQKVTAEVTPHHFSLSDDDITENHGKFKMAPPIRSLDDLKEILIGLKDGTLDCIATDHAPHAKDEKDNEFEKSANGIVGLETAFSLGYTNLVETGILTISELIEKLTINPAKVLGIDKGNLEKGKIADICIINTDDEFVIDGNDFKSKSKITPFQGKIVKGKVLYTFVSGKIALDKGKLI